MKKTYVYFLVPLVGLIIFGAIYWNFSASYEAKEAEKARIAKEAKEEKLRAEARNREQAIKDAIAGQERRKKERAIKEAKDRADREARDAAIEEQRKARNDQDKFTRQVERLEKEVKNEQDAIARFQATKVKLAEEETFLKTYVKLAQSNVKKLSEVLDKVIAADAARAKADADAAAAAAKGK
jgi:colicin import membrane protein